MSSREGAPALRIRRQGAGAAAAELFAHRAGLGADDAAVLLQLRVGDPVAGSQHAHRAGDATGPGHGAPPPRVAGFGQAPAPTPAGTAGSAGPRWATYPAAGVRPATPPPTARPATGTYRPTQLVCR